MPVIVRLDGDLKGPAGGATHRQRVLVVAYATKEDTTPLWVEQQTVALDATGHHTVFAGATLPEGLPKEHSVSTSAANTARYSASPCKARPNTARRCC